MRLVIALAALALAAPAAAQQGRIGEAPQGDADLRGTVGPAAPLAFAPLPIASPELPYSPDPDQARQCRLACAQDYYFCLAQDEQSECSPGWRACFLSCGV